MGALEEERLGLFLREAFRGDGPFEIEARSKEFRKADIGEDVVFGGFGGEGDGSLTIGEGGAGEGFEDDPTCFAGNGEEFFADVLFPADSGAESKRRGN